LASFGEHSGGGEGTHASTVSSGADYVLNSILSSPAYYESHIIVSSFHPSTSCPMHII